MSEYCEICSNSMKNRRTIKFSCGHCYHTRCCYDYSNTCVKCEDRYIHMTKQRRFLSDNKLRKLNTENNTNTILYFLKTP